jgi:hypothetical protein
MKNYSIGLFILVFASLASLPIHAQVLADAAANYSAGTIGDAMTPVSDGHGGTWAYDLAFVNNTATPTAISGKEILTYQANSVGGSTPYYGTTGSNSYSVISLPIVSNGVIFPDSPSPAAGPGSDFLELHPGGDNAAVVVEWTAGAGETGNVKLTFDLSRSYGNPPPSQGPVGSAGYDDFGVYRGATKLYGNNDMYIGPGTGLNTDTGVVTEYLTGVTIGTKIDFVLSADEGVLGYNLGYLSAQISEVPEPGTWALVLGGVVFLITLQRVRRRVV